MSDPQMVLKRASGNKNHKNVLSSINNDAVHEMATVHLQVQGLHDWRRIYGTRYIDLQLNPVLCKLG